MEKHFIIIAFALPIKGKGKERTNPEVHYPLYTLYIFRRFTPVHYYQCSVGACVHT